MILNDLKCIDMKIFVMVMLKYLEKGIEILIHLTTVCLIESFSELKLILIFVIPLNQLVIAVSKIV